MNMYPSDKKKLLSLPFYLAKRSEDPLPRKGQEFYALFKEMTGEDWFADSTVKFDREKKITEFDFENYLNPALLKGVDTTTPEFKEYVRKLNFVSKTWFEAHQEKK
jgi:hypothetical protein